jgi:hypothetical protein
MAFNAPTNTCLLAPYFLWPLLDAQSITCTVLSEL